jgi:hypothetical protein
MSTVTLSVIGFLPGYPYQTRFLDRAGVALGDLDGETSS